MDQENTQENASNQNPPTIQPAETTIHEQNGTKTERQTATNSTKIILAVAVLILLVLGIFLIKNVSKPSEPVTSVPPTTSEELSLVIAEPKEAAIVSEDKVTIQGKTAAKAVVLAYSDQEENSVEADSQGNFTTQVLLKEGINDIVITSFVDDGQEKSVSMSIVYNP